MVLLSVIVPMYNERECAQMCHGRISEVLSSIEIGGEKADFEIIFVDDGSTDGTLAIIKSLAESDKRLKVIGLSKNFGQQAAFSAGMDYAKGDALVFMDADLQDPPELVPEFVEKWREGCQIVYGVRKRRKGESKFKRFSAKLYYRLLNVLADVKIPQDAGDFRLIDKCVAEAVKKMPEHNRFLRGMSCWTGFRQASVEYERDSRFSGRTKYGFFRMMKLAADGILSFSAKPLKIVSLLGAFSLFASLLLFVYVLASIFSGNAEAGWASIICVASFFGGLQLTAMGIIGEYIARIFEEVKRRPNYIVDFTANIENAEK